MIIYANTRECITSTYLPVPSHVAHCFVVASPLNALFSVKPQLRVNTIIPNTVQITAGSLAREYHGPFVKTKYADAGNYH